jgi:hypothetical protein
MVDCSSGLLDDKDRAFVKRVTNRDSAAVDGKNTMPCAQEQPFL